MDDIRRRWRPDDHRHHRGRTPDGLRTGPDPAGNRSGSAGVAAANQHVPAGEGIEDEHRKFISVVLNDTEKVWTQLFRDYVRGGGDHDHLFRTDHHRLLYRAHCYGTVLLSGGPADLYRSGFL